MMLTLRQTIVQLLEAKDPQLTSNIHNSSILISSICELAESHPSPPPPREKVGSQQSDDEYDEEGLEDGEGEIYSLAKRILELIESDDVARRRFAAGDESAGEQPEDHAALRASVHQALRG